MPKSKINPEYLKATHLILLMYPGAPSFEEQIEHDAKVQEQLEKEMRDSANGKSKEEGVYWCNAHQREATHIDQHGKHRCDPKLPGIMLSCDVVFAPMEILK